GHVGRSWQLERIFIVKRKNHRYPLAWLSTPTAQARAYLTLDRRGGLDENENRQVEAVARGHPRLAFGRTFFGVGHAAWIFHDAGAPDASRLERNAETGPGGHHPCRPARVLRRFRWRASDRSLRERDQQHDVSRHADSGNTPNQACDRNR